MTLEGELMPEQTLTERAREIVRQTDRIAGLSMFEQPGAVRRLLPDVTGLLLDAMKKIDDLERGSNGR